MNYLKQILLFESKIPYLTITSDDIAVYHALLLINNNQDWKEFFVAPNEMIVAHSKVNPANLRNCISRLQKQGLIAIQYNTGKTPNRYSVVEYKESLSVGNVGRKESRKEGSKNSSLPIIVKQKHKHKEYVYLTEEEFERLQQDFGVDATNELIQILDDYISYNPEKRASKYTDHNRVLRGWVKQEWLKRPSKPPSVKHDETFGVGW